MTTQTMENPDPNMAPNQAPNQPLPDPLETEALEQQVPTSAELAVELNEARARADEHWDALMRARADLDNLRKRQATELEKAHKFALDSFVRELLPVQDSLELGHDAALAEGADVARLREGTELTLKLLGDTLGRFGVAAVEPLGEPFNPELHQAISVQPRADLAPNTVSAVMQKGYTLNGRLVRPALVMVSRAP